MKCVLTQSKKVDINLNQNKPKVNPLTISDKLNTKVISTEKPKKPLSKSINTNNHSINIETTCKRVKFLNERSF